MTREELISYVQGIGAGFLIIGISSHFGSHLTPTVIAIEGAIIVLVTILLGWHLSRRSTTKSEPDGDPA